MIKIADHQPRKGTLLAHHRWHLEKGEALPWHRHHFTELFWVEQGSGWQESPERRYPIQVGDLICMPHDSVHRLVADSSTLTWCNVMISTEVENTWRKRYRNDWSSWPWEDGGKRWRLSTSIHRQISHHLSKLNHEESSKAMVDQWFLSLWQLLHNNQKTEANAPNWLTKAMEILRTPAGLQEGLPALIAASNRCPDHLARVVRKYYGTKPSLLIRDMRLDYAAALIRTNGDSILEICLECGFDNPSYFARAFKIRYGTTPLQYRKGQPAIGTLIPHQSAEISR